MLLITNKILKDNHKISTTYILAIISQLIMHYRICTSKKQLYIYIIILGVMNHVENTYININQDFILYYHHQEKYIYTR